MKFRIILPIILLGALNSSCVENLLDQTPTTEISKSGFWTSESDALTALNGAMPYVRNIFSRDYYFDGHGEYARVLGTGPCGGVNRNVAVKDCNFGPEGYGSGFDGYYQYCYASVNACNYVINNVTEMVTKAKDQNKKAKYEEILGEARLMRGMTYFRMISMWGDVIYFDRTIEQKEMFSLSRTPITTVKDSIYSDFTYAYNHLPDRATDKGRANKWAALGFRGKLSLYWACWKRTSWPWTSKGGWPELKGFEANQEESDKAYKDAAEDFKTIIEKSGRKLFRNGEPGECDNLGMADKLPNYYYLFIPATGNGSEEILMSFTQGGPGTGQGDENLREFGTRASESGQGRCQPFFDIINRYQSTETGDFCAPLHAMAPNEDNARTALNSTLNPLSYANRDYRMKSTLLWDDEILRSATGLIDRGYVRYRYRTYSGTIDGYKAINADADGVGYIPRKFIRLPDGNGRGDGTYSFPLLRLADVYLMYAEASNEAYGPNELAIDVVNRVRHRGNLPALTADKYKDKLSFFNAIEQERIVELFFEGQRGFDIRRWRKMEEVWGKPYGEGKYKYDTHGNEMNHLFNNADELTYQRQYIFRIPPVERNKNANLTQNTPWL